jgi:hypothetical protein
MKAIPSPINSVDAQKKVTDVKAVSGNHILAV